MSTPTTLPTNSYLKRCTTFITSKPIKLWSELAPRTRITLISASAVLAIYVLAKSLIQARTWVNNFNKAKSVELGDRLVQELNPLEVRQKMKEYKEALAATFLKTGALLYLDEDREEHYGIASAGAKQETLVVELKKSLEDIKKAYQSWESENEVILRCAKVHEKAKEMITPLPKELKDALVETAHIADDSSEIMTILQMIESLEKVADVMLESWEEPQKLFEKAKGLESRNFEFEDLADVVFEESYFSNLTASICRAGVITQLEIKRLFANLKPHVPIVETLFTSSSAEEDIDSKSPEREDDRIRTLEEVFSYLEKQCEHYSLFVETLITGVPCAFVNRRTLEGGQEVDELIVGQHPLGESIGVLEYSAEKASWFLKGEDELTITHEEAKALFYYYHTSMREAWVRKTARDLLVYPGKRDDLSRILQESQPSGNNKKILTLVAMKLAIIEENARRFYEAHKILDDQFAAAFELFYTAVSGGNVEIAGKEFCLSDYFLEIIVSPESFESLRDYLFPPMEADRLIESESQPIVTSDILVEVQRSFLLDPKTEAIKETDFLNSPEEFKELLKDCVKVVFYLVAGNEKQSYCFEDFATSFAKAWWIIMSIRAFSKEGTVFPDKPVILNKPLLKALFLDLTNSASEFVETRTTHLYPVVEGNTEELQTSNFDRLRHAILNSFKLMNSQTNDTKSVIAEFRPLAVKVASLLDQIKLAATEKDYEKLCAAMSTLSSEEYGVYLRLFSFYIDKIEKVTEGKSTIISALPSDQKALEAFREFAGILESFSPKIYPLELQPFLRPIEQKECLESALRGFFLKEIRDEEYTPTIPEEASERGVALYDTLKDDGVQFSGEGQLFNPISFSLEGVGHEEKSLIETELRLFFTKLDEEKATSSEAYKKMLYRFYYTTCYLNGELKIALKEKEKLYFYPPKFSENLLYKLLWSDSFVLEMQQMSKSMYFQTYDKDEPWEGNTDKFTEAIEKALFPALA